jgi:hypothetical protein
MRSHPLLLMVLTSTLLTSCTAPSASGFYWGQYPQTLYAYKKKPAPTTRLRHQNELLRLIDYANNHNTRVPPGVYAELGKLYWDQGEEAIAFGYFQKEQQLYPESTVLINQIQHSDQKFNATVRSTPNAVSISIPSSSSTSQPTTSPPTTSPAK